MKKLTVSTNLIQRHLFEMSYLFKKCSKLNLPENCVIAAYGNPRLPFQKIYHRQTKKVEKKELNEALDYAKSINNKTLIRKVKNLK